MLVMAWEWDSANWYQENYQDVLILWIFFQIYIQVKLECY